MVEKPIHEMTIAGMGRRFREGSLSPVALTEHLLQRIERLDPKLGAFRKVTTARALSEARAAEAVFAAGQNPGPLHGIPYVAKDLFDVKGEATMAGTRLLKDNVAAADCHVVRALSRAGMVLLGKTHTVQFAFGGVGINHDLGTPHNPWHAEHHVPGGSSSGSAVAVSTGLAPMGLGSDTGGSVRIPAALCGLAGLKSTIGRIGRSGVYPLSWSHDSVGPLARSVEDCALVYEALQGPDPADETTAGLAPEPVLGLLNQSVQGLRIAFCETLFFDGVDAEVEAAVRGAAGVFESLGARVGAVEVPEVAEAFSFGKRALFLAAEACTVNGRLLEEHFDELDPVVAYRMIAGRELLATDYFLLQRKWAQLGRSVQETLRDVDVLIAPTTQVAARPVAVVDASRETYGEYNMKYLRNTSVGNVLNLCGVSVPCGFDGSGLPIGLMLYAKPFAEGTVLRAAQAFEQAAGHFNRHPDLAWAE